MLMSFRQEITAVRESIASVVKERAQDPACSTLLERLDYSLEELRTADDELTARARQLEQLTAEVHAVRARYRALFMMLPVPCLTTDLGGVIQVVNNAAVALFECEGSVVGKPLPLRFVEHERGLVRTRITRARLGEPAAWHGTIVCRPHGHAVEPLASGALGTPVSVTLSPLQAPGAVDPSELLWTIQASAPGPILPKVDFHPPKVHDGGPSPVPAQ